MARQSDSSDEGAISIPDPGMLLRRSLLGYTYLSWPDLRYRYVNPALARITGMRIARILGRTPEEVLGPELPAQIRPVVEESLGNRRRRGEMEVEAAIAGRPGEKRVFRIQYYPVYASEGAPTGIWFVVQDITEQRRLEAENRRQRAHLQAVMDTVPAGILLSDTEGNLVYANQEASRIWGHPLIETDPAGYGRYEIYHVDGIRARPDESGLFRVLKTGAERVSTNRLIRRPDGSWVHVFSNSAPLRNEAGQMTGGVVVLNDISALKRLERQQQRLMEIAQAVNAGTGLPDILRMVRDTVLETAAFDRAGLWLYDAERGGMRGTWGTDREGRPTDESDEFFPLVPTGDHPLQRLLRGELRFFLTPTYEFSPQPSSGVSMHGVGAHATLALRAYDRVIGMLFVDNLLSGRPIAEEDLQTLLPCCEQAAVAIESARLQQTERQQTADLREAVRVTNHRVKNSLQVVVALLDMQLLEHEGAIDRATLERIKRQVRAMAAVHAFLGDTSPELDAPIREILEALLPMLEVGDRVHCRLEAADAVLTVKQATAIALILNELIGNAATYGGKNVEVVFRERHGTYRLEVSDEGPGFPSDFALSHDAHLGLHYVERLARWDLLGRVSFGSTPHGGAKIVVDF